MKDYLLARSSNHGTGSYGSLQLEDTRADDGIRRREPGSHDGQAADETTGDEMIDVNVPAEDDTLSMNTPRMWTLSILFSLLGSCINLMFSLRYPSITVTPLIALLLAHPLGLAWDGIFSSSMAYQSVSRREGFLEARLQQLQKPGRRKRLYHWLAQGRWNQKEHALVFVAANVSFGFAYATDVLVEQQEFYHQSFGLAYQLLLILSSQIVGYAFAGICRKWLVYPTSMVWPATLMSSALFGAIHVDDNPKANGWTISRYRFFSFIFIGSFVWYFFPGLLMPALSYFSILTWIKPDSSALTAFFGVRHGLGMFPVTFDWSQIAFLGSPLMTPWWAEANMLFGFLLFIGLLSPILYFCNVWYSAYMPILSANMYDNRGEIYNVSRILSSDYTFNESKYQAYSPLYFPIAYAVSYGLQFAALTSLISHTFLYNRKEIMEQWRRAGNKKKDLNFREMQKYKEAPLWWYLFTFVVTLFVSIFLVEYYPVHLPWWGLMLSLGMCFVFFIPIGRIMAITNQMPSLFLACQIVCGTLFPGRPVANMIFVTYGYISSSQGLKFSSDLKLGQYMKLAPRVLFAVQLVATVVSCLAQIGMLRWMLTHVRDICTMDAVYGFICPFARIHFNGTILWGVLGPERVFISGLYSPLLWCFLIGLLLPIPIYFLSLKKPFFRDVNFPVLLGGVAWIPPATGVNFLSWALVGWIFNRAVRLRATAWWNKYTMILSAALDSGMALSMFVIFFAAVAPDLSFHWWGTEVYKRGCDWVGCPLKTLAPGETFGPE